MARKVLSLNAKGFFQQAIFCSISNI
jgi:hypothetical protein